MTFRLPLLLSTLVWVVQILAPLAHLPHDHEGRSEMADCSECPAPAEGVQCEAACSPDRPCDQPGHHHHHGARHHDSHCLLCKTLLSRLLVEPQAQGLTLPLAIHRIDLPVHRSPAGPAQRAHPARGPPHLVA